MMLEKEVTSTDLFDEVKKMVKFLWSIQNPMNENQALWSLKIMCLRITQKKGCTSQNEHRLQ